MSYLLDLLKSLDENELNELKSLALTKKEAAFRDEYIGHYLHRGFDETLLPEKLGLTKSYFDKLISVLLDKALARLAGNETEPRYVWLLRKNLYDLILHELKITEKRLKKLNSNAALKEFYEQAFRVTCAFNFNSFPEKESDYYCKAYIQTLSKKEDNDKYQALGKQQLTLAHYYLGQQDGEEKIDTTLNKLLTWQTQIKGKKLYKGEFAIFMALSACYEYRDQQKSLDCLLLADEAAKKVYDQINNRDKLLLLGLIGQQLMVMSRYKESIETYEELFLKFPEAGLRLYHPYQFVFVLLIEKRFKRAAEAMQSYIEPFLKNENARNFHFDILRLYAILHLLNHETEKAGDCLQRILQFSKKDFTPIGDVLFRFVHNIYCVQTGDYALAQDVFKKNLKYVDSKSDIEGMENYKDMFMSLGKVIRHKRDAGKKDFAMDSIPVGNGRERLYMDLIRLPL